MFSSQTYLTLALVVVLFLNETGGQRFGQRNDGHITRCRKKILISDDHQGYTGVEEICRRLVLDSARKARKTPVESNAARNHEAYSERVLPDDDEAVDFESLQGEGLKLTRLACNYSKRCNQADSIGGNLPANEKVLDIGTEKPFQGGGRIGKAMDVLEGKRSSETLLRNGLPIRRGGAIDDRIVTAYPKLRFTVEEYLVCLSILCVVVLLQFYCTYWIIQELVKHGPGKYSTSQNPSNLEPASPPEDSELQQFPRLCDNCRILPEVINELLTCLSRSKVILSKLEKQIQNRLQEIPASKSTQKHGESLPPQMTTEMSEFSEEEEEKSESPEEEENSESPKVEKEKSLCKEEEEEEEEEEDDEDDKSCERKDFNFDWENGFIIPL